MKNQFFFLAFISTISIGLVGCTTEKRNKSNPIPALYETKSEAEKAAKNFGCSGAHKMGEKWMPCNKHGPHHHNH